MSRPQHAWGKILALWLCLGSCVSACKDDVRVRSMDAGAQPGTDAGVDGSLDAAHDAAADSGEAHAAAAADSGPGADEFRWSLPSGFPMPVTPVDNPMTAAKVELGRHLFYDKRLSDNQTQSCASCHRQELAFTDGRATGLGSTGKAHPRGPMSLVNLAYATSLTWANPLFAMGVLSEPLERQTQIPLYGDAPIELGMKSQSQLVARLQEVVRYRELFQAAFPKSEEPISAQNIGRALAAFERVLISGDSAYDRFWNGDGA